MLGWGGLPMTSQHLGSQDSAWCTSWLPSYTASSSCNRAIIFRIPALVKPFAPRGCCCWMRCSLSSNWRSSSWAWWYCSTVVIITVSPQVPCDVCLVHASGERSPPTLPNRSHLLPQRVLPGDASTTSLPTRGLGDVLAQAAA